MPANERGHFANRQQKAREPAGFFSARRLDYLVVVVVVDVDGEVVVVLEGDIVVMLDGAVSVVVVVDGVVVEVVVDVDGVVLGASMIIVVEAGGVLTTGGGLFITVGFSHALTTTTASDAANNIEYFMFISPDVQKGTRVMRLR